MPDQNNHRQRQNPECQNQESGILPAIDSDNGLLMKSFWVKAKEYVQKSAQAGVHWHVYPVTIVVEKENPACESS